tara:strand:+ start:507 stop:1199 length:693 start_codon:yes stop_codon:yes gene_type:complete
MKMNIKKNIADYLEQKKYNIRTDMCRLFESNKTDKSTWHNYTTIYNELFSKFINKNINFFELGIGSNNEDIEGFMGKNARPGASLYAFREYFKNANICGADIDDRILFDDTGIWTFYVDQTDSESIKNLWNSFEDTKFDIIIDDGLHDYDANITFFENSIDMLENGGIYIIEDILENQKSKFADYFSSLDHSLSFILELPMTQEWANSHNQKDCKGIINTFDNNLGIIIK